MSDSILVTYATRYGSTQQVAKAIAATLRKRGLGVALQPAREVQSLDGYRAVVLGAPLYFGALHKDAQRFLTGHQQTVASRPVALFALGPTTQPRNEEEWQGVQDQLDQQLARYPWLAPVAVELFGGKYDPARLRLTDRLIASLPASPLHGLPASDLRDWTAVRAWAGNLAATLQSGSPC
jgi:menaquinone-dependent protoporphyrinogen oxidase